MAGEGFRVRGEWEGSGDPDLEERVTGVGVTRRVSKEGTGGVGADDGIRAVAQGAGAQGPCEDQGVGWLVSRVRVLA